MRRIFNLVFLIFSVFTFSQDKFLEGKIKKNDGATVNGFVKANALRTPQKFQFKESLNGEIKEYDFKSISEVEIITKSKFIYKKELKVSMYSKNLNYLDSKKEFGFLTKSKFLEVLVEGYYNLYLLEDDEVTQFFYTSKEDSLNFRPLLYKEYYGEEGELKSNNEYKVELYKNLKCDNNLTFKVKINGLKYEEKVLRSFFYDLNECISGVKVERKRKEYGIAKITPYFDFNIVKVNSNYFNFPNNHSYGLGFDAEYNFSYIKGFFSLLISPNFSKYSGSAIYLYNGPQYADDEFSFFGGKEMKLESSNFGIPLGLRIYPINKNFKLYCTVNFLYFGSKEKTTLDVIGIKKYNDLNIGSLPGSYFFEIGTGYKKISMSYKFSGKRDNNNISFMRNTISLKYNIFETKRRQNN